MPGTPLISVSTRLGLADLAPGVLTQLGAGQLVAPTENLPVINTRVGNVFEDRFDPNLRWYIPAFTLVDDPDPAFAFQAVQGDGFGVPFNQATVTFDVRLGDPVDLAKARAANPTATFRPVPLGVNATLTLPYRGDDGTSKTSTAAGQVSTQPDGGRQVTFSLQGPAVIVAYQQLTQLSGATITLQLMYESWQRVTRIVRLPAEPMRKVDPSVSLNLSDEFSRAAIAMPIAGPQRPPLIALEPSVISTGPAAPVAPVFATRVSSVIPSSLSEIGEWDNTSVDYYVSSASQDTQTVALGLTFQKDVYRPRYTITSAGVQRPIIDVNDLAQFASVRSEYRELTSLGDVQARYPSFRRLYLGQVSGTVVAIPANYGIVRSSTGTDAHCEAVVDPSPASLSGCRFQFTFTLAPQIDPIDLAQLAHDIPGLPEAAGRSLQLTLPTGLDPRTPASLSGFPAESIEFSDGVDPHSLLLQVTIADEGTTPAITRVSVFLNQLVAPVGTPLFGTVAVRLDDVYTPPVQTSVLLNLRATADSDDLAVSISEAVPPAAVITNHAPFDLQLLRSAMLAQGALAVSSLNGATLASGQTATLPGEVATASAVFVARTLALPSPFPEAALLSYVSIHTATVQQVQHALTVDATAVDFAAASITQLDIQFKITGLPDLPIDSITLTSSHAVDFVHVLVPIGAVVVGLSTIVTISIASPQGVRQVNVTHDFLDDPILILSNAQLA